MVNLPDTPGSDNSGVCINSGIPNRSVYLIAEGLSAECLGISIGCDKTEQIYYRTLTTYLTKSSQFVDARRALIQAAEDIYGPTESQAVATEFEAVGVTEDSTITPADPSSKTTNPFSSNGVMAYLWPKDGAHDSTTDLSIASLTILLSIF